MRVPFVDLKAGYLAQKAELDAALEGVLNNTAFIGGGIVKQFEDEFAAYIGAPYCVSAANGTDAIEMALRGFGIGAGDEVIVPANTFFATAEAVTCAGATVVFADCEPKYFTLDPEDFRKKITPQTKAVIPVHLYGHPADMDAIMAIAREHNLLVIEDTSQAHGALYRGKKLGSIGDAGTFSFYPSKNLGAFGDAGAVVFHNQEAATQARLYANHGSLKKNVHEIEGRNSRLDGIQAAVLSVKLKVLDAANEARRKNAAMYDQLLAGTPGVVIPVVAEYATPVYHLYVIRVANREGLMQKLGEQEIGTGFHYPLALPYIEAYADRGYQPADYPVAHAQMGELLSLPMYPEMTEEMIGYVVDCLKAELVASETETQAA